MSNKNKYEQLINELPELVGGLDNVSVFTHCVTRLRLNVKDKSLVKTEEIAKLPGVLQQQYVGDQYQIVIGNAVAEVYAGICKKYPSLNAGGEVEVDGQPKKKFSINTIFEVVSGCVSPLVPVIISAGMLKLIMVLGTMTGLIDSSSSTYYVLNFVADSAFYFVPIFVGGFAARKFNASMGLGMLIGAMMIHPDFVSAVNCGTALSFFGLPIYASTYASTVIPAILAVLVMSYVEKFFRKYIPDALKACLVPLGVMLVMTPLTLCLIAPLGNIIGNYFATALLWVIDHAKFIGMPIVTGFMSFIVMTGMHMALNAAFFELMTTIGCDPFIIAAFILSNVNQGIACLAVALKTKKAALKVDATTCGITAIVGGVTEPGIFGITLKYKTPMYAAVLGGIAAGLVTGFFPTICYNFAGVSIFGLPGFISPEGSMASVYSMIAGLAAGIVVTFVATWILYKDTLEEA